MLSMDRPDAVITMHGFYSGAQSITHFEHAYELADYEALPHLYFVLIMGRSASEAMPVAGFFIKTRDTHLDESFDVLMHAAAETVFGFERLASWQPSVRPAKIGVDGGPLGEVEMLRIMVDRFLKNTPAFRA
mgnify:CR=1 FL=1|jgi:hypothetical protein